MSYVLITRPEIDAKSTAIAVQEKGYEVFCQSFLEVIYHDDLISDLEKYSALIFTSINGVRAYVQNIQNRDLPVFTVGDRTQAEVRQAGFKQVKSASGNVDNLIKLLSEEASKKTVPICTRRVCYSCYKRGTTKCTYRRKNTLSY